MPQRGMYYAYIIICAHLCPLSPESRIIGLTSDLSDNNNINIVI